MDKEKKRIEEELDGVTGGGWENSSIRYESGDTPRYRVGQIVCGHCIRAINEGKHGLINKEFTYVVTYGSGDNEVCDPNMYESELMRLEGVLN